MDRTKQGFYGSGVFQNEDKTKQGFNGRSWFYLNSREKQGFYGKTWFYLNNREKQGFYGDSYFYKPYVNLSCIPTIDPTIPLVYIGECPDGYCECSESDAICIKSIPQGYWGYFRSANYPIDSSIENRVVLISELGTPDYVWDYFGTIVNSWYFSIHNEPPTIESIPIVCSLRAPRFGYYGSTDWMTESNGIVLLNQGSLYGISIGRTLRIFV